MANCNWCAGRPAFNITCENCEFTRPNHCGCGCGCESIIPDCGCGCGHDHDHE